MDRLAYYKCFTMQWKKSILLMKSQSETAIWSIVDSLGIKKVEGLQPIRIAISGMTSGPSL